MWLADLTRPLLDPDERPGGPPLTPIAPGKRSLTASLPPRPAAASPRPFAADEGLPLVGSLAPTTTGGDPLPADVRQRLEASFGFDLTPVRVHHDGSADRLGARALHHGRELHFAAGEYAPHTADGFELVAHEVAHLAQTALGRAPAAVRAKVDRLLVASAVEDEADAMARQAARGRAAWSGAGGSLRPLPALSGPVLAKLKVGGQWQAAKAVAEEIARQGLDGAVAETLLRWANDDRPDHDYQHWGEAIAAARHEAPTSPDGKHDAPAEAMLRHRGRDTTIDVAPAPTEEKVHGPPRTRRNRLIILITIVMLLLGVVALLAHQTYDVRSSLDGTASIHRRPLEPVMQQAGRLQDVERNPDFQHVRAHITRSADPDQHPPELEAALETLDPILQPLAPVLDQAVPQLQTMVHGSLGVHDLQNPANVGLFHEQIMLANGQDVGRFPDGVHGDRQDLKASYGPAVAHYDAALMERAVDGARTQPQNYRGVNDNCQDFVDDVVAAYRQLGGRDVVLARDVAVVAITDLLVAGGGWLLERQVDAAVSEELAAAASVEPSQCARELASHLGLDQTSLAPAIESVLDQQVSLPMGTLPLRTALCGSPAVRDAALTAADAKLDTEVAIPHDEKATVRAALCQPKGDSTVMQGVLFELVNARFGEKIRSRIPAFIAANAEAARRLVSDLTRRLADNLYRRLNLRGLC